MNREQRDKAKRDSQGMNVKIGAYRCPETRAVGEGLFEHHSKRRQPVMMTDAEVDALLEEDGEKDA